MSDQGSWLSLQKRGKRKNVSALRGKTKNMKSWASIVHLLSSLCKIVISVRLKFCMDKMLTCSKTACLFCACISSCRSGSQYPIFNPCITCIGLFDCRCSAAPSSTGLESCFLQLNHCFVPSCKAFELRLGFIYLKKRFNINLAHSESFFFFFCGTSTSSALFHHSSSMGSRKAAYQ